MDLELLYAGLARPIAAWIVEPPPWWLPLAVAAGLLALVFLAAAAFSTWLGRWFRRKLIMFMRRLPMVGTLVDLSDRAGALLTSAPGRIESSRVVALPLEPVVVLGLVTGETEKLTFVLVPRAFALASDLRVVASDSVTRLDLTAEGVLRNAGSFGILPPETPP